MNTVLIDVIWDLPAGSMEELRAYICWSELQRFAGDKNWDKIRMNNSNLNHTQLRVDSEAWLSVLIIKYPYLEFRLA